MIIPASYLFRDIYSQHWEEPDAPIVIERHTRFIDGLLRPVRRAVGAMLTRPGHPGARHHFGGHAYE